MYFSGGSEIPFDDTMCDDPGAATNIELREDGSYELREDGSYELRE